MPVQLWAPHVPVGKEQVPSAWPAHVPAQDPEPHVPWPVGGAPEPTGMHVPTFPCRLQARQAPVQAWSQHTPSGEQVEPATQPPAALVQPWPRAARHTPFASHVPEQLSVSSCPRTGVQALLTQVWQVPGQSLGWQQPLLGMHVLPQSLVLAGQL